VFETIRPGRVADDAGAVQAAHINVCLFARGLLRHIYTRLYFEDDPALTTDPVLALVPEDRRGTLIASRVGDARWSMDIRLQGEDETVFFDL
jgi:protocatechuate 3,4-dioxygenase alpha subunit